MGNIEVHDLSPVRADERKHLSISRKVTYKQYCKHVKGEKSDSCLADLPWAIVDAVSLYEGMDASFNCITSLPAELPLRLPHLNYLNLGYNCIKCLPDSFALLFHLKTVVLCHNQLIELPKSFIHLVKLEKLDLSHNNLSSLPGNMGAMESLGRLNVAHNKLQSLPVSLGNCSTLTIILAQRNRLKNPPQAICDNGSASTLRYLQTQCPESCKFTSLITVNEFKRTRGSQVQISVPNPHSAEAQYVDAQSCTASSPARIKIPLLPPLNASQWNANVLKDKVLGLIYGAAIGDAVGVATEFMSSDESHFHYTVDTLNYSNIVRDNHRVKWKPGDWTTDFDQVVLVLDCVLQWGGVVDELDFAKRLDSWNQRGFPELGDVEGFVFSNVITKVVNSYNFLNSPHSAARALADLHNDNDDDNSQVAEELADNAALARTIVLGIPGFHKLDEVAENAMRICKATHTDPRCIAAAVMVSVVIALMLQGHYNLDDISDVEAMITEAKMKAMNYLTNSIHKAELENYAAYQQFESLHDRHGISYVFKPLSAGVTALRHLQNFRDCIGTLILQGDDSNTNACVAGAFLGCKVGFSNLPEDWVQGLRTKQVEWLNIKLNTLLDMMGLP